MRGWGLRQGRAWAGAVLERPCPEHAGQAAQASAGEVKRFLTQIPYAEPREAAEGQKRAFQAWCGKRGVAAVGQVLDHDWNRLAAFHDSPGTHWQHVRATNPSSPISRWCACERRR